LSEEQTQLLREMRDLLRVMAEPALAQRDQKRRAALTEIVGRSAKKARAVLLMDGSRNQKTICAESGIDQGDLSRLEKALRAKELIVSDEKRPTLVISLPPNFFDGADAHNG
jgi:hypothetical protein